MKKIVLCLSLITSVIGMSACQPAYVDEHPEVEVQQTLINANLKEYDTTFTYKSSFFEASAEEYNPGLAMLSLSATLANGDKDRVVKYFEDLYFDDIYLSADYDTTTTKDSAPYCIAHRKFADFDLIAVGGKGFNYKAEWANNFTLGETGDHEGFNAASEKMYLGLKKYIEEKYPLSNLKIWVTGYSRTAALGYFLAHKIMQRNEIKVESKNLFVYTFEGPAALAKDNTITYKNIFNIVNDSDVVPLIPPVEYGLYRAGTTINVTVSPTEYDKLQRAFDYSSATNAFTPVEGSYSNENEFIKKVFSMLMVEKEEGKPSLSTRSNYVKYYQDATTYLLETILTMPRSYLNDLFNYISSLSMLQIIILLNPDSIRELLVKYLDKAKVTYDLEKLTSAVNVLTDLITEHIQDATALYLENTNILVNLRRILNFHFPAATYILLENYNNNLRND